MNFRIKIILVVTLLCSFTGTTSAQTEELSDRLRDEVEYLCDSIQQGRGFGNSAGVIARAHIVNAFRKAGLCPLEEGYTLAFSAGDKVGHNVVGLLPGSRKGKYTILSTYVDGLGCLEGNDYPGADSNASGVAALLSIADSLKAGGNSVLFIVFDGRNADMAGSRAFFNDLREGRIRTSGGEEIRPSQITLVSNIDIIGASLSPVKPYIKNYVIALGAERYASDITFANVRLWVDVTYDYYGSRDFTKLFYRKVGDQRIFIENGIPCVVWTSGITMNTNRLTDVPPTLDYPVFANRVMLICRWLQRIIS